MEIEFKQNGFEWHGVFFTFSSINRIDKVEKYEDNDIYREKLGIIQPEYASYQKQYMFKITFNDGQKTFIGETFIMRLYESHKITFKEVLEKKYTFWQWLFRDGFVKNKQLDDFIHNETDEMKQSKKNVIELREKLIKKYNEWKDK